MDSVVSRVDSVVVSISAFHVGSPGSIPRHGRHGIFLQLLYLYFIHYIS